MGLDFLKTLRSLERGRRGKTDRGGEKRRDAVSRLFLRFDSFQIIESIDNQESNSVTTFQTGGSLVKNVSNQATVYFNSRKPGREVVSEKKSLYDRVIMGCHQHPDTQRLFRNVHTVTFPCVMSSHVKLPAALTHKPSLRLFIMFHCHSAASPLHLFTSLFTLTGSSGSDSPTATDSNGSNDSNDSFPPAGFIFPNTETNVC